jgi:histidine ammonia-lyase
MGWSAGLKLREVLANLARILAIELICAGRALDFRSPLSPSPATGAVRELLRETVPGIGPDRWLAPELQAAERLICDRSVSSRAEAIVGELN